MTEKGENAIDEEQRKAFNPMRTPGRVGKIMDDYFEELRGARANGRLVAWTFQGVPAELLEAMDIASIQAVKNNGRINNAGLAAPIIQEAEAAGYSENICSLARANIGYALLLDRGKLDHLPERLLMPKPDLLFTMNDCSILGNWAYEVGRITGAEVYNIQTPYMYDKERRFEYCLSYVEDQLGDVVRLLERLTGRPFNWEKLRDILLIIKRSSQIKREIHELCKRSPSVRSLVDSMGILGVTWRADALHCRPEAVRVLEDFKREIEERIERGVVSVPGEEVRLGWIAQMPWYAKDDVTDLMAKNRTTIVGCGMYGAYFPGWKIRDVLPPDGIDPEQPIKTLAALTISHPFGDPMEDRFQETIVDWQEGLQCDGLVFASPRTCRPFACWMPDLKERAEQELGMPCILIEDDHSDKSFYSKAQFDTRLEAFVESVKARKESPKAREKKATPT